MSRRNIQSERSHTQEGLAVTDNVAGVGALQDEAPPEPRSALWLGLSLHVGSRRHQRAWPPSPTNSSDSDSVSQLVAIH
ncbi:hypothetical protein VTN96DRAFT_4639 [Rasamsonia emersonii]